MGDGSLRRNEHGHVKVCVRFRWKVILTFNWISLWISLPCPNPLAEEGFQMDLIKREQPSDSLLKEIRSRLLMIDGRLLIQLEGDEDDGGGGGGGEEKADSHSMTHHSPLHPAPTGRQLISRMIVCSLLLKVSAQLHMKKEVSTHLHQIFGISDQMHSIASSFGKQYLAFTHLVKESSHLTALSAAKRALISRQCACVSSSITRSGAFHQTHRMTLNSTSMPWCVCP